MRVNRSGRKISLETDIHDALADAIGDKLPDIPGFREWYDGTSSDQFLEDITEKVLGAVEDHIDFCAEQMKE